MVVFCKLFSSCPGFLLDSWCIAKKTVCFEAFISTKLLHKKFLSSDGDGASVSLA